VGDVEDLFVELLSVKNTRTITFFNGKNAMFRNTVHSQWVYLTYSAHKAIFSIKCHTSV